MASVEDGQQQQDYGHIYSSERLACWLQCLGDQLHHGFYEKSVQLENASALKDDLSSLAGDAAVRLIDKLLVWANITDDDLYRPRKILDVGCAVGGASRYLATKFGSGTSVHGISLGKVEVEMAKQITAAENLSDKVSFSVADALELPFPDNAYELVWCMECAEHIWDKQQLIKEFARVTTPGGRIVLATMCCPEVASLSESDKEKLKSLFDILVGAPCTPLSCYVGLAQEQGLEAIEIDNWTKYVIPGLKMMSLTFKEFANDFEHASKSDFEHASVLGGTTRDYFEETVLLLKGYEQGLVHYNVFTATKPSSSSNNH